MRSLVRELSGAADDGHGSFTPDRTQRAAPLVVAARMAASQHDAKDAEGDGGDAADDAEDAGDAEDEEQGEKPLA